MALSDFGPGYRMWKEMLAKREEARKLAARRQAGNPKRPDVQPIPPEPKASKKAASAGRAARTKPASAGRLARLIGVPPARGRR